MQRSIRKIVLAVLVLCLALPGVGLAQGPKPTPQPGKAYVQLETSKGDIVLELDKVKAPVTVANFLKYVKKGHYDGTIFHRVINGFMIQGGGFDTSMNERPTDKPIKNEADNGLRNTLYTVAMARTSNPQSATAQFYINVKNNSSLDFRGKTDTGWGYAVFGEVWDGKRVVDAIKGVATGRIGPFEDVPLQPVVIKKVVILSE
jgi:peptidyl-prolyl cis-trans isomerase B (cyclophilin B)